MTSAKPDQKRARRNVVRGMSAVGAVGLTLAVPHPAAAAPAPCERAETYTAQSGVEFLHVDKLDGPGYGPVSNAGLAEAKSALVADATVNSAAVTRLLDADKGGDVTEPLIQQAPPTNARAARQRTPSGKVGPFAFGSGSLTSHARWDPRMACGRSAGEVTRAEAAISAAGIGDVVRVPQGMGSRSTTAFAAGGRTVATAGITATRFELLDGAVYVKVLRPPALVVGMSAKDGGAVRYVPPVLEVLGRDIRTTRLSAPGAEVEFAVSGKRARAESSTSESVAAGPPLPLPALHGLPKLGEQEESAHADGSGTRVRIALGRVRQATVGHAIAAKATAIRIGITKTPADDADGRSGTSEPGLDGYGGTAADNDRLSVDLGIGLLEAGAVAPARQDAGIRGNVRGAVSAGGTGAGLPITGSPVAFVATGGVALMLAGAAALAFGARRRRMRP